jgi:putative transcriptional regulator
LQVKSDGGGELLKLGNHLKRCRFDNDDMSQEALAQAVGVTRQTIFSIEKGRFVPSALLALKIAHFFNKPVEEIFFIPDDEKIEPITQQ